MYTLFSPRTLPEFIPSSADNRNHVIHVRHASIYMHILTLLISPLHFLLPYLQSHLSLSHLCVRQSYGLAVQKGSHLAPLLNKAILELRESGELDLLRQRWWRFAGECSDIDGRMYTQKGGSLSSLPIYPVTLRDMAVAVLLLFLGIIAAIVFLVLELIYHTIATKARQL